jgi:F-type H+-transporting ATPase subunit delta
MQNPRLASRYAKSLMDIATEQNKLDAVYNNMSAYSGMIASSEELRNVLSSPIISAAHKNTMIKAISGEGVEPLTMTFTQLLTSKGRESLLGEIATEFMKQYKSLKNIITVHLTTAEVMDEAARANMLEKIGAQFPGATIDLQFSVDTKLIGGFVLESNNKRFDASIARDLRDIQKQFLENEYVPEMR